MSLTRTGASMWHTNYGFTLLQIVADWEQSGSDIFQLLLQLDEAKRLSSGLWAMNGSDVGQLYGPFPERGGTCPP